MEIGKIVAVGLIATVLILVLKKNNPEFGFYISLMAGIIIFYMIFDQLKEIVSLVDSLASKVSINQEYIKIILKIISIAYIAEFGVQICKDSGQSAIASKIEIGGKVLILVMSLPVVHALIDTITKLM